MKILIFFPKYFNTTEFSYQEILCKYFISKQLRTVWKLIPFPHKKATIRADDK